MSSDISLANRDRVARYAHDKKDIAGHLRRHGIDLVEDLGPVGFVDPHTLAYPGTSPTMGDARLERPR